MRRTIRAIIMVALSFVVLATAQGIAGIQTVRADGPDNPAKQEKPADQPVTASTIAPVVTASASDVTGNSAAFTVNFKELPAANKVIAYIEWGDTDKYGNKTPPQEVKSANGNIRFKLTALLPKRTYHFRAKVVGKDTLYSDDQTFTTTGVTMRLAGPADGVKTGSTFSVDIQLETDRQPVNSAAAYLKYDQKNLKVVEIVPDETSLPTVFQATFDNNRGEVSYTAVVPPGETAPAGTFKLATVIFTYKGNSGTTINFTGNNPRKSDAVFGEGSVLGTLVEYTVTPKKEAAVKPEDGQKETVQQIKTVDNQAPSRDTRTRETRLVRNVPDMGLVKKMIAGLDAKTPAADVNGDGKVDVLDLIAIERIAAGLN